MSGPIASRRQRTSKEALLTYQRAAARFHTFSLEGEGPILRNYKVFIDGNEVRGVRGFSLKAGVNEATELTLNMIVSAQLKDILIPEEGISTTYSEPGKPD